MTVPGTPKPNLTNSGTPYDTAIPFIGNQLPSWVVPQVDRLRVASYDLYDSIYRNVVGTFQLVARGTENNPIYIPSAKTIVEACNRYLAVDFDYQLSGGSIEDRDAARLALDTLFRKTKFYSKFVSQKRYGLIRGDAIWHVVADPGRKQGSRIQLFELDPRTYFPIVDVHNPDVLLGCHIILRMQDPAEKSRRIIKRQTYEFNDDGTIQSSMNYYLETAWDDRINPDNLLPYQVDVYPISGVNRVYQSPDGTTTTENIRGEDPFDITLPETIDCLPIYHIKNSRSPGDPFGVSELSGIERIIAAINQAISDEELTLALDGLGLYATNSGPPTDDAGNPMNWMLGPGRVVEIEENAEFKRVTGVGSVQPSLDHLNWLVKSMRENSATSNISIGIMDNARQQSGIALVLEMLPLLAKNKEKETEMMQEYDNLFNDLLKSWLPAYEEYTANEAVVVSPVVGDPMPVDRTAVVGEVVQLVAENIITIPEAQSILEEKLGYEFNLSSPEDFLQQSDMLAAMRDPFGARLAQEEQAALDASNNSANAQPPTAAAPTAAGAA